MLDNGLSRPYAPRARTIFAAFLRLGLTAFGGPAMVPFIERLAVEKRRWLSRESFRKGVAVAQAIPGATAMQTAAYSGLRARGLLGAAAAYVGFGLPALVLITLLSAGYGAAVRNPAGEVAFRGLQAIVVAIVARAAIDFGRKEIRGVRDVLLALPAAAALYARLHPAAVIVAAAFAGAMIYRDADAPAPEVADGDGRAPRPSGRALLVAAVASSAVLAAACLADPRLPSLALVMARVNVLAFGGGFSALPLLHHEVVETKAWMGATEFMDGVALGQVTPGPILMTSAFVGYRVAGLAGAVVAAVATFLPSFLILVAAVPRFDRLERSSVFRRASRGVIVSFVGLLVEVALRFGLAVPWTPWTVLLGAGALGALLLGVDVLWVVLAGAAIAAVAGGCC